MATVLLDKQRDAVRKQHTSRVKISVHQHGPMSPSVSLGSAEDLGSQCIEEASSEQHSRLTCPARCSSSSGSSVVSSTRQAYYERRFQLWRSGQSIVLEAPTLAALESPKWVGTTLDASQQDKPVWWLDVHNACQDEIRQVCKVYELDRLIVATILAGQSQEKMAVFWNCHFVSIRSFDTFKQGEVTRFEPCSVYLILFPGGVLSFNFASCQSSNRDAQRRLDCLARDRLLKSAWVGYVLIHEIIMNFNSSLDELDILTSWIEEQVYTARLVDAHVFLQKIEAVRRRTGFLMRLISRKPRLLSAFASHCSKDGSRLLNLDKDEDLEAIAATQSPASLNLHLHISDVQDLLSTLGDALKSVEKALSRSQNHYLAYLDLNNVAYQRRVSRLLSRTALVYLTCTFVNVISGLFGSNLTNFFADYDQGLGFGIICSFVAVFVLAILWLARKWRNLRSRDLWP